MKKILLAFVVAGATMFGCSKSDPELQINQREVKIKYDESFSFKIEGSSSVQWSSDDDFVGKIDANGVFTAKHIGESQITGKVGDNIVSAKVIVEPKVTEITEPIYGLSTTKSQIKSFEKRKLIAETADAVGFEGGSRYESTILYIFDNAKWSGSVVGFTTTQNDVSSKIAEFFSERYTPYTRIDDVFFFHTKDGKHVVALGVIQSLGVSASYFYSPDLKSLNSIVKKHKLGGKIPANVSDKLSLIFE